MKKLILANLAVCWLALQMGGPATALASSGALKTEPQKIGYAFGMSLGESFKNGNLSLDADFLGKGARAQLTGVAGLMTADEVKTVLMSLVAGPARLPANKKFKNAKEQLGYAVGVDFAQRLQASGLGLPDLDLDNVVKGVKDMTAGKSTLLTPAELKAVFTGVQAKIQEKQAALEEKQIALLKEQDPRFKAASEKNLKDGTDFLAGNKTAPGVKSLTNGLQYLVLAAGAGPVPKPTDVVKLNYRATFLDGTQFDASPPDRPTLRAMSAGPAPGWAWLDVLKLMPAGSKWRIFIPPDLAFGARGCPPTIPPNAALIFEVEVVSIEKAK